MLKMSFNIFLQDHWDFRWIFPDGHQSPFEESFGFKLSKMGFKFLKIHFLFNVPSRWFSKSFGRTILGSFL